jgi:hypothetical protein
VARACASARFRFIFQLPATNGRRIEISVIPWNRIP